MPCVRPFAPAAIFLEVSTLRAQTHLTRGVSCACRRARYTCSPRFGPTAERSRADLTRTRMAIAREFVFRNRFKAVAGALRSARGPLLDVGARDRGLATHLDARHLSYFSADVGEGHDLQIDLERPLDVPDARFDHVVALDVLEHVENIHGAFHELARIARVGVVIALPNMATLSRRLRFALTGGLGTDKYDLLTDHHGDRHRWLTTHRQGNAFIQANAQNAGVRGEEIIQEIDEHAARRRVRYLLSKLPLHSV